MIFLIIYSIIAWYDYDVTRYQRDRQVTELEKVFEEKLTPGGTEVDLWRTEQVTEAERVKVKERVIEEDQLKGEVKRYKTESMFINEKTGEKISQSQESGVHWKARQQAVPLEPMPEREFIHDKEVRVQKQKQVQKESKGNLDIQRNITTTETMEKEHKAVTKERKVVGQPAGDSKPPVLTKKIAPCRVFEGEAARFECHFTGVPAPEVSWFRENFQIQNSQDFKVNCT